MIVNKMNKYIRASVLRSLNPSIPIKIRMLANRTSFVYPNLGVHFDRIAKNANNFTYIKLNQFENGYEQALHRNLARKDSIAAIDMPLTELPKFKLLRHLVVVRNPFDRALSVFLDKVAPGTSQNYSIFPGYGDKTRTGFKRFLSGIENEKLRKSNHHMWSQKESMVFNSISYYTDVVRFENFETELGDFFRSLGVQSDIFQGDEERGIVDPKKVTDAAKKRMDYLDEEAAALIEAVYQEDFRAFGYSADLIAHW